jgi:pimeloyl-ACP methyl ester carboxylesterase
MPTLTSPDCELQYDVYDLTAPWIDAPETILFHHGLGAASGTWAGWFPALADRFRIVTFDMRGHGRSAHPSANAPLSLELLADDIFRVADATQAQRFHLVGESIGGTIALLAALSHPQRIRTLTVSNGAHIGGSIRAIDDWRQIMDTGGMAGWSQHMMRGRFFDGALTEAMWRWYERSQASVSSDFVLRAVRLLAGADLSARLSELTLPVLLLHGDSSPFISPAVMADLKSRLPDARLQVFAHAKHGLPFSHARECSAVLRSFVDGNSHAA